MPFKEPPKCYLIGNDSLLIQCVEVLLAHQYRVLGIISPLVSIKEWASTHDIPYFDSLSLAEETLANTEFDYLFSVANRQLLSPSLLARPKQFTINYHDAPLPAYAGAHATSWAILNNEINHGITWHLIDEVIDGGTILKQIKFDIDKDEIALSLNLKCYQYGIQAFTELVAELSTQTYQCIPQDLNLRTYYHLSQKPPGNGWISWQNSAADIDRLCRALCLGQYLNQFSLAKFMIGTEVFILDQWQILAEKTDKPAGTLVKLTDHSWQITTHTQDFLILQVSTVKGQPCHLGTLAKEYQLTALNSLTSPSLSNLELLEKLSTELFKHEDFWVQEWLQFKPATLPFLPLTLSSEHTFSFSCVDSLTLPDTLREPLRALYPNQDGLENILLTACLVYLHKLENQENVGVGLSQDQQLIPLELNPFFTNLVPFMVFLDENMHFKDAVEKTIEKCKVLKSHLTYQRDLLRRYPRIMESPRRLPIVITIGDSPHIPSLQSELAPSVILVISADGNQLSLWIDHSLIEKQPYLSYIIHQLLLHIKNILTQLVENHLVRIHELNLVTSEEQQKILVDWNKTETVYPKHKLVSQLFEEQVEKTPQLTAIVYKEYQISYTDLNQKANQLAHYLQYLRAEPNQFIGIYIERGIKMIAAIMAILKVGAAYIPIAESSPLQLITSVLQSSGTKLILTTKKLEQKIRKICTSQKLSVKVISLDKDWSKIETFSNDNLPSLATPTSLAYIIYTSGTTGLPKGVMIRQHSLVNLAIDIIKQLEITPKSRVLQFAAINFDASVWEIFSTLLAGAALCIPSKKKLLAGAMLSTFIIKNKITHVTLPPSILHTLSPRNLNSLHTVITAGEPCSLELTNKWKKNFSLINAYGPTETTICSTMHHVSANAIQPHIGKPIANSFVYVLDKYLKPAPICVGGELYIGGEGVAAGYLNQPELTKNAFIPNPLQNTSGSILYKTGDLVRWLPDGNLDYLGRSDNQAKVRGFRVELEAVEAHLLHYHEIEQCAVVVQKDKNNCHYLVAYIVTKNPSLDIAALRKFLADSLPEYMIPSLFLKIEELPLTPNGKIDHHALVSPATKQRLIESAYIAPQSSLEKKLHKIWGEILGVETIGVHDSFFSLGGHSLLITKLILQLLEEFNYNLSLQAFARAPTIYSLAKLIGQRSKSNAKYDKKIIADTVLDKAIKPLPQPVQHYPNALLLTGATGFLGAHLLSALYHTTQATIYCLVRSETEKAGLSKLEKAIKRYQLNVDLSKRIVVVKGDLTEPQLGLSTPQFHQLAEEVDAIYHNGAYVHHLYDYETLKLANVSSTIELIKLTTLRKNKFLHYVSSLSAVINFVDSSGAISEDFLPPHQQSIPNSGYNQSKWVSEKLLAEAHLRGINTKIYRPGWILGQRRTGIVLAENNHLLSLLKGCIQLGYAPNLNHQFNILPVDDVARYICELSINDTNHCRVFNLSNPHSIAWATLIHYLNDYGYPVQLIPYQKWHDEYLMQLGADNALYGLLSLYINSSDNTHSSQINQLCQVSKQHTTAMLEQLNIPLTEINESLIKTYFSFLEKDGFFASKEPQGVSASDYKFFDMG